MIQTNRLLIKFIKREPQGWTLFNLISLINHKSHDDTCLRIHSPAVLMEGCGMANRPSKFKHLNKFDCFKIENDLKYINSTVICKVNETRFKCKMLKTNAVVVAHIVNHLFDKNEQRVISNIIYLMRF